MLFFVLFKNYFDLFLNLFELINPRVFIHGEIIQGTRICLADSRLPDVLAL